MEPNSQLHAVHSSKFLLGMWQEKDLEPNRTKISKHFTYYQNSHFKVDLVPSFTDKLKHQPKIQKKKKKKRVLDFRLIDREAPSIRQYFDQLHVSKA